MPHPSSAQFNGHARPDSELIKSFVGPKRTAWAHAPFIQWDLLPDEYADPKRQSAGAGAFDRLPWNQFVLSMKDGRFIYVVRVKGDHEVAIVKMIGEGGDYVENETWASGHPDPGRATWTIFDNMSGKIADTSDEQHAHYISTLVAEIVRYLVQGPKFLVEVTSSAKHSVREKKTARLKPWAASPRMRVILLAPLEAKRYGHGAGNSGSHASPRIHQRRGHWHELRHEKYTRNEDGTPRRVWVRPAWVGERVWQYQGSTYRVLVPEPIP